jgi:C1A family cysteine protease
MRNLIVIFALFFVFAVYAQMPVFQGSSLEQFEQFKQVFNRSYKSQKEEVLRFKIFSQNLIKAQRLTEKSNGATQFGVTQFSDLTTQEFKHLYLMSELPKVEVDPSKDLVDFPLSGGWNHACVGPVLNQGQCGSCWAFSATEEIQSMCCIQKGKLYEASEQQIVSCDTTCYGCNGGWTYLAYQYVISAGGLDSYASYPYTCQTGTCQFNPANVILGISAWSYVGRGDENVMKQFVLNNGPLSICVDAASWQFYQGGVITSCGDSIDHCVQLVDYFPNFQGYEAWYVRNSWGTSWGYNGYLYVQFGKNMCAISDYPTTVTCSRAG